MIDPLERWREYGGKPDYAGPLTYGGAVCTQDPALLAGFDVAIVGAPMDDLVSDRPGARYGPRAIRAASCPAGPHLETKVDAFAELRIVDYGDAPVLPADAARSHAAIEATVGEVLDAGLIPVVPSSRTRCTSSASTRSSAAPSSASATAPCSCRSTSTSSTPRLRPEPARRSPAGSRAPSCCEHAEPSPSSWRSSAPTWWRSFRPRSPRPTSRRSLATGSSARS